MFKSVRLGGVYIGSNVRNIIRYLRGRKLKLRMATYFAMSMLLIFSITVGQTGEVSIGPTQKNIDAEEASLSYFWSGNYLKKSELCTSPSDGSACSDQFYDCLKV